MVSPDLTSTPIPRARTTRGSWIFDVAAPFLLLLLPLVHYLRLHQYPFARVEVLLLAVLTGGIGLLLGGLVHRSSPLWRIVILTLLTALVLDFQTNLDSYPPAALALVVIGLLATALRKHFTVILTVTTATLLVGIAVVPPRDRTILPVVNNPTLVGNQSLHPLLHFVLDEQIGLLGMPDDPSIQQAVSDFYTRWGFRLYTHAYARFSNTYNALSNLVNLTTIPEDSSFVQGTESPPQLRGNAYFDILREHGYRLRVYQSNYLDLCRPDTSTIASCYTYSQNTISYIEPLPIPATSKAAFMFFHLFTNGSYFYRRTLKLYRDHGAPLRDRMSAPRLEWSGDRAISTTSPILARMTLDLDEPAGTAAFAHLLFPHYPYMYGASCEPHVKLRDRLDRWSPNAPFGSSNTIASRAVRYQLYNDQMRCMLSEFDTFLTDLDARGVLDSAVIIIHGDHGSRITMRDASIETYDDLTTQDLVDLYSTQFAVRSPAVRPGLDSSLVSIDELLRRVVERELDHPGLPTDSTAYVLVPDKPGGRMRPIRYPDPAPLTIVPNR